RPVGEERVEIARGRTRARGRGAIRIGEVEAERLRRQEAERSGGDRGGATAAAALAALSAAPHFEKNRRRAGRGEAGRARDVRPLLMHARRARACEKRDRQERALHARCFGSARKTTTPRVRRSSRIASVWCAGMSL